MFHLNIITEKTSIQVMMIVKMLRFLNLSSENYSLSKVKFAAFQPNKPVKSALNYFLGYFQHHKGVLLYHLF